MTENLLHWSALCKTDPAHTKPFQRAGGFQGTATKPIWTEYRLTEHFGPCGVGWGCDEPAFNLVPANDEILVFCTVAGWYMHEGKRATVFGVGGDKVLVKQQSGLRTDDEAYKKAFTDALGNAFKHVGAGADVHMGLFEDSKYVESVKREFSEGEPVRQSSPADDPKARAETAAKVMRDSIESLHTLDRLDRLIANNTSTLEKIKAFDLDAYTDLMSLANARRTEFLSAA